MYIIYICRVRSRYELNTIHERILKGGQDPAFNGFKKDSVFHFLACERASRLLLGRVETTEIKKKSVYSHRLV